MENHIQNDNRKALPKYLLAVLCAGVLGGVLGVLMLRMGKIGIDVLLKEWAAAFFTVVAPWGIPVSSAFILGSGWLHYRRAKKMSAEWNGEDEETAERTEDGLDRALLMSTLQLVLDCFFFSTAVVYCGGLALTVTTACLVLSMIGVVRLQQNVVDLTRQLNPEKQGSVYDSNFKKKWFASCDEAQQRQIGQAAFRAYSILNVLCPILWGILLLLNFVTKVGLLPSFMVLLIWGVLDISYIVESIRLCKTGRG